MGIDPDHLVGLPPRVTEHAFSRRDTILYALGVGAGQDPGLDELRFVYEPKLEALPSMAVVLAYPGFWQGEPQYGIDWKRVLHAEQSVTWHAPLPVEGVVLGETTIDKIVDKGAKTGALLYASRRIFGGVDKRHLATVRQTSFLRGDGGRGGTASDADPPHPIPARTPDATLTLGTRPEQALVYRLSGDYNPLHVDPQVAIEAGFPGPILHGLCTYGVAARALLTLLCGGVPDRLARMDCRFTGVVFPGDSLTVSVWREEAGRAAFQVHVEARGRVVADNGFIEFREA